MNRIGVLLTLLLLLPAPLAAGADAVPATTDPATFRWAVKCSEIPTPRIAICRIVQEVAQGVIYRGPFVPITFQIDNRKGRSVSVGGDQNCLEQPAMVQFGTNPPFTIRNSDSITGAMFDRVIAEFRAAKKGVVEYAPLPDCKRVSATFYYSNLDDVLAKAVAIVGGGGS
jgi:hypothetical protein